MSKMLEYHTRAMDFVAQATVGSIVEPVDEARKHELFRQALDWGLKAIEELDKLEYHDLTYSVIHRSIAATALDCGEYQLAEKLAAKPINRGADPAVLPELRQISDRAIAHQNHQQTTRQPQNALADDPQPFGDQARITPSQPHFRQYRASINAMDMLQY